MLQRVTTRATLPTMLKQHWKGILHAVAFVLAVGLLYAIELAFGNGLLPV
jgi:hypothetical protein